MRNKGKRSKLQVMREYAAKIGATTDASLLQASPQERDHRLAEFERAAEELGFGPTKAKRGTDGRG